MKAGRLFLAVWPIAALAGTLLAAGLLVFGLTSDTPAQKMPPDPNGGTPVAPKAAPGAPPLQQPLPVSIEQALYLIQSTLLTLNDANRSGNYTVLRNLAAPDLQARNTAADLALIFSDLRRRRRSTRSAYCISRGSSLRDRCKSNLTCSIRWWPGSGGSMVSPSRRRKRLPDSHRHRRPKPSRQLR